MELSELMDAKTEEACGAAKLTRQERKALLEWGFRMYRLGQHVHSEIDKIKYDGRVIILEDGTRWEVDSSDTVTSEDWLSGDAVVVIDDRMYKLDKFESVAVEEDSD